MKERKQLNLRLDSEGDLLDEIREAARLQDISLNQFVVNALRASLSQPIKTASQPLDKVLDRVEELEKKWLSVQEQLDILYARHVIDRQLDKLTPGDREAPEAEPRVPLDAELDKELDKEKSDSKRLYTDAEVATLSGCDELYVKNLRLGKEALPSNRDFWEQWQPVKNRARWRNLQSQSE